MGKRIRTNISLSESVFSFLQKQKSEGRNFSWVVERSLEKQMKESFGIVACPSNKPLEILRKGGNA